MITIVSHGREHRFSDGYKAYSWAITRRPEWFTGLPDDDHDGDWLPTVGKLVEDGKLPYKNKKQSGRVLDEKIKGVFE